MADVTLDELRRRLGERGLVLLDVRTQPEFEGLAGAHCDPRQGHIPGAVNLPLDRILECRSAAEVRELVGLAEGVEIVAYCHTGSRSGFAVQVLRGAGYEARNYEGSWHEWSRAAMD
ncbi:MAG TPA: rhodanese-like domain-containing protein [Gaiellaceae bacterium]|nr:rhodanese-like domain-containing protein [Gaiellaceae bacterium]